MKILQIVLKLFVYIIAFAFIVIFNYIDSVEAEYKENYKIDLSNVEFDQIRLIPNDKTNFYSFEDFSSPYYFSKIESVRNKILELNGIYAPPLYIEATLGKSVKYYSFHHNSFNSAYPENYDFDFTRYVSKSLIVSLIEFLTLLIIQIAISYFWGFKKTFSKLGIMFDCSITLVLWYYSFGKVFLSWWL